MFNGNLFMKKSFLILFTFSLCSILSALPGVTQKIPDSSGQFIYYRDSSFERESYFGAVYFDDNTYGVRYFAPAKTDETPLLPKKDIYILFSLDSSKDYVELTGERIMSAVSPDDTDIINYLHDMIYELSSRRQKAGIIEDALCIEQDYEQFGGNVKINFEPLVPIFNIKSIQSIDGKALLTLITAGQLISSSDDSFTAFEGMPLKTTDSSHQFEQDKKAKKQKISYSKTDAFTQKITLDSQWSARAENLYSLGSNAILALDIIELSGESPEEREDFINGLYRKLTLGNGEIYPYSELLKIETKKNTSSFQNLFFNDISKSFTRDFKTLTRLDENHLAIMTLTVFQGAYKDNSKYFERIIKSYSVN